MLPCDNDGIKLRLMGHTPHDVNHLLLNLILNNCEKSVDQSAKGEKRAELIKAVKFPGDPPRNITEHSSFSSTFSV